MYVEEYVDPTDPYSKRWPTDVVKATVVLGGDDGDLQAAIRSTRYPTLGTTELPLQSNDTCRGRGRVFTWHARGASYEEHCRRLDEVAPVYRFSGERWIAPSVGRGKDRLAPLMLWWALLFGYSILARYEPAAWAAAVDLREEPWAAAIMASLDEALDAIPELLWLELDALSDG